MAATYILENVDPTYFNFLSSFINVLTRSALILALSSVYGIVINWHLSNEGSKLPVSLFGNIPGGFIDALSKFLAHLRCSWPLLIMVLLFAFAEYSESLSNLGLFFVEVHQQGPMDVVMSLRTEDRNHERLLELSGDPPVFPRTSPVRVEGMHSQSDSHNSTGATAFDEAMWRYRLTQSLLTTVKEIALGESLFASGDKSFPSVKAEDIEFFSSHPFDAGSQNHDVGADTMIWGGLNTLVVYGPAVSSIPLDIPLDCISQSTKMVPLQQYQGSDSYYYACVKEGTVHRTRAMIPNCTFAAPRQSGIYNDPEDPPQEASIVEVATLSNFGRLVRNGSPTDEPFLLTPEDKVLARDREDWRKGRVVQGFDGLRYGEIFIPFASAVVASGSPLSSLYQNETNETERWMHSREYLLVGRVEGECPTLPTNRRLADKVSCLVMVHLFCEAFEEDFEVSLFCAGTRNSSRCTMLSAHVVWGVNFEADDELAASVAGVYALVSPRGPYTLAERPFITGAIPAALFALGGLDMLPSLESVVRPKINAVYIFFMLFPLGLGICVLIVQWCQKENGKDIPTTPYHMMIFGKEHHETSEIPKNDGGNYPDKVNNRLVLEREITTPGTSRLSLEIAEDPYRFLQDDILHYLASRKLKSMSVDEQEVWIREREVRGTSDNQQVESSSTKIPSFVDQKVDDRLTFLNAAERRSWLVGGSKDEDPDVESSLNAIPTGYTTKDKSEALSEPDETNQGESSSEEREKIIMIDGGKGKCIVPVCSYNSSAL